MEALEELAIAEMRDVLKSVRLHEGSATEALRRLVAACEPVSPYLALLYSQSQELDLDSTLDAWQEIDTEITALFQRGQRDGRIPARPDRGLADRSVLQPGRRDRVGYPRGPRRRPRFRPTHHRPTTQRSAHLMTRRWFALGVLTLAVLLIGVDGTVLALATPFISADLGTTGTQILWIGDIYSFVLAALLISMGSLGDRIGHKKLLLCGATAFAIISAVAAYSSTPGTLIATRALLGVAGATLAPATLALIRGIFPDQRERSIAVGVWASAFSAGAALGPMVGGVLLEHFWWGSVFLINIPVCLILVVGGIVLLPEHRNPEPGPWDLLSVALSMAGMLGVVYGIKEGFTGLVHGLRRRRRRRGRPRSSGVDVVRPAPITPADTTDRRPAVPQPGVLRGGVAPTCCRCSACPGWCSSCRSTSSWCTATDLSRRAWRSCPPR